jgi:hypothetical protein
MANSESKDLLENISKKLQGLGINGSKGIAPIDFQDFQMHGLKSIHEIYSFGHDPLRFINGITQMMSGEFIGVDRYGNPLKAAFGLPQPDPFLATLSWLAHIMGDFCNSTSTPYPGATFLMEFGNAETRTHMTAAYRAGWNSRSFVYQGLAFTLVEAVLWGNELFKNYDRCRKISFEVEDRRKFTEMRLVAHSMVTGQNLIVNGLRAYFGDSRALIRVNFPSVMFTLKTAVNLLIENQKEMAGISNRTNEYLIKLG